MDRNNRPLGREKNVVNGSMHVGRRSGGAFGGSERGGGGKSPLTLIIILVIMLLGGGGGLSSILGLLGGGSGSGSGVDISDYTVNQTTPSQTSNNLKADTSVASEAREKRTVIRGDGSDRTTIMVYMCGTDLETKGGYASKDLKEMEAAAGSDNITVLVFTGGTSKWATSSVSNSKNQIFQVKDGDLKLLKEYGSLFAMTDPNTLTEFIQWSKENYPADRYDLIFWDHGGGSISGYGYDEMYKNNGSMTLDKIGTALKNGGCTFDFIGFDACLMATLETALTVEPYADYLIASEETEPGCGWYYTSWMNEYSKDPSMPTLSIGKNIVDGFVDTCEQVTPRQQATLSVVDLAELSGTVPDAFRSFAVSTSDKIKNNSYQSVSTARSKTKEFGSSSKIDQVDLIHLSQNMKTTEGQKLAGVLDSAVKYNRTSSDIMNANGISIYFPYSKTSNVSRMTATYDKIGLDSSYSDCIRDFASVEAAGQTVSGGQDSQMTSLFDALMSSGGSSSGSTVNSSDVVNQLLTGLLSGRSLNNVNLTGAEAEFLDEDTINKNIEYITNHQFDASALVWKDKNGEEVIELSEDQWELIDNIELNVFVDDGEGYIDLGFDNVAEYNDDGDLLRTYDRTWLSVNRQAVAYYMMSAEGTSDDYKILGRIPAYLNSQKVNLIACFTDENPNGEILGAAPFYNTDETETQAKGLIEINDGDRIDFFCNYYDYDKNFRDEYLLGDSLTVSGKLELANMKMDNTGYIATYRLTDIYNNHYWTPAIEKSN